MPKNRAALRVAGPGAGGIAQARHGECLRYLNNRQRRGAYDMLPHWILPVKVYLLIRYSNEPRAFETAAAFERGPRSNELMK